MAAEQKGLQRRQGTRSGRGHMGYGCASRSRSSSGLGRGALDGDAQSSQVDGGLWRGLLRAGGTRL